MKNVKSRANRRLEHKDRIINIKNDEINKLRAAISDLEIDGKQKDELIGSVDALRNELIETIEELKKKGEEYDKLIADLREMKRVFNKEVLNDNWWIIKHLVKR